MRRAVMVMFDSLNRRMLPAFGGDEAVTPHFDRLAGKAVAFDNCYGGSMPCMPARREMHTGRYNFLHRSWGPLEPFDDSVPEMLVRAGVYTHLVTDHQHYWEDGGATYHNRYSTYELIRGQEGDRWKGHVEPPPRGDTLNGENFMTVQDRVNRLYMEDEADHTQTRTVDAGLHFIDTNHSADKWFLQIECFDPHEPFFTYNTYRELYGAAAPDGPEFDWPSYRRVIEDDRGIARARQNYLALLSQCDSSLGRVLDAFDRYGLWEDTLLIVCTDHGFFLGERGWWGKSVLPWYDETIHTPLFVWDPREPREGEHRDGLVQTIDFGPTLLDYFDVPATPDMQGSPLVELIRDPSATGRSGALFGSHGGHVSVTDGRFVYMRSCDRPDNTPLVEYTVMPTHMRARFAPEELQGAELAPPFGFTKGVPLLRVPGHAMGSPARYGTQLFDLKTDPHQSSPLVDDELELRMAGLLVGSMRDNEAPADQFERLGLPAEGPVGREHLRAERDHAVATSSMTHAARRGDFGAESPINALPLAEVLADGDLRAALGETVATQLSGVARMAAEATILDALAWLPQLGLDEARIIDSALGQVIAVRGQR